MDDKILAAAQLWKDNVTEADLASELDELMADPDPEKLSDAFYRSLSFGTAGLRGTLGVGTNRMNVYTVSQATQGLATYLNAHFENPTRAPRAAPMTPPRSRPSAARIPEMRSASAS